MFHHSNTDPPKPPSIAPLFLTVFIDMLGLGISIPVLAVILLDPKIGMHLEISLPIRTILYGFLLASYPIAQFFGAPILGALSDRYGRRSTLIISLIGTCIGYALFGLGILSKNLPLLFFSRSLDGFTGGNLSIAVASIADISDEKTKSHNFGLIGMAFGLGLIVGPYLGGKLADHTLSPLFNPATPFIFAALLSFVNILLFLALFRETLRVRTNTPISAFTGFRNLQKAFRLPHLRIMLTVVFLLTFGFNFFTQFFQVFLVEKFGFHESQIGDLFGYTAVWLALTQGLILPLVCRRFRLARIISLCSLLLAFTLPLLLIPDSPIWLYVILPFIALFDGLVDPTATTIVSNLSAAEEQGEILGIKQSLQSLAAALPPLISGFIAIVHVSLPVWIAAIATFVAWLVFVLFFRSEMAEQHHCPKP